MVVADEGAPKGVVKGSGKRLPIWETEIEGVKVARPYLPGANGGPAARRPTRRCGCPAA